MHAAPSAKCDVFVKDVKGNGSPQIIIIEGGSVTGFDRDPAGIWRLSARWATPCSDTMQALRNGEFAAVGPEAPAWPDLDVAGQRLRFTPGANPQVTCPKS